MGMADLKLNSEIHHLKARIAELEAALHIATNDKLSLLDQLDREKQARMAQIDYGCDLQRIIEDLCRGGPIREPKTSARHHYNMAAEAISRTGAVKVDELAQEIRRVDGSHSLGAGALAEALMPFLSAFEPAAPEGQQEAVDKQWLADWQGRHDVVMKASAFKELSAALSRPSEQAVTDEMVEAAVQAVRQYTRETLFIDEHRELVRTALKAAMEAGHD